MDLTEGMKAFAEKYSLSLDDPRLRGLYEYDLSARRDQAEIAHTARELGEALGEARGEARGIALGEKRGIAVGEKRGIALGEKRGSMLERTATIRNMLGDGLPLAAIYKYIDAPHAEIDAIIADLSAVNGA